MQLSIYYIEIITAKKVGTKEMFSLINVKFEMPMKHPTKGAK